MLTVHITSEQKVLCYGTYLVDDDDVAPPEIVIMMLMMMMSMAIMYNEPFVVCFPN